MSAKIIIVGAGAHGRKIAQCAQACGIDVLAFATEGSDPHSPLPGISVVPVSHLLPQPAGQPAVVAIGDAVARRRLSDTFRAHGWTLTSLVHPTAYVAPDAILRAGVVVLAGALVEGGCEIRDGVIVDTGAIIDHDCTIGEFSHVQPGATLAARSRVPSMATVHAGPAMIREL